MKRMLTAAAGLAAGALLASAAVHETTQPGPHAPAGPPVLRWPEVTNLGLDLAGSFSVVGETALFPVSELGQGASDLNGDGDAADDVLFGFAEGSPQAVNLAIPSDDLAFDGSRVAYVVAECAAGCVDQNGDGDVLDQVVRVRDLATGLDVGLGLATDLEVLSLDAGLLVFRVGEAQQGRADLNGDGDLVDGVLHVLDLTRGTVTNLGLAGPDPLHASAYLRAYDGWVVFAVSESAQGGVDLNGDGDALDEDVLHVYDPATRSVVNLGLAVPAPSFTAGRVLLPVSELEQGQTDLNGDGDGMDTVLHVYDPASQGLTNAGLASLYPYAAQGTHVALLVTEHGQGDVDLNGDGDTFDHVVHVYDVQRARLVNTGLVPRYPALALGDSLLAVVVNEGGPSGVDLNGDGDRVDGVLHVWDLALQSATNVGLAASSNTRVEGRLVAFDVPEAEQGQTDLNADGDAGDSVLHVFDASTSAATNVGLDALVHELEQGRLVFLVREAWQGAADLNGDHDAADTVLHAYDTATGALVDLRLAASGLEATGDLVLFDVLEGAQGGLDLNGDGDDLDRVAFAAWFP